MFDSCYSVEAWDRIQTLEILVNEALSAKFNMAQYVGTVIGTKMDKTVKVLVTRMALYTKLKTVRR